MHSTWTLVPVSPGALTSFQQLNSQQSDKKYENFNISRLYIWNASCPWQGDSSELVIMIASMIMDLILFDYLLPLCLISYSFLERMA